MLPILLDIGPFTIHSLWLMLAVGLVAGAWVLVKLRQKSRLNINFLTNNGLILIVGALIASRLAFVLTHPVIFFGDISLHTPLNLIGIWDKGLSGWGAVVGFLLTFVWLAKREDEPIKRWLDVMVIALMTTMIFVHFGAFLDGINYGRETVMPWGITFESGTVKYVVPIHPTQLYAMLYTGILTFITYDIYKKWKVKRDGLVTEIGVTSYLALRFLEEFFRGDETWELLGIRVRLIILLLLTAASGVWLYKEYGKHRSKVQIILEQAKETLETATQKAKDLINNE